MPGDCGPYQDHLHDGDSRQVSIDVLRWARSREAMDLPRGAPLDALPRPTSVPVTVSPRGHRQPSAGGGGWQRSDRGRSPRNCRPADSRPCPRCRCRYACVRPRHEQGGFQTHYWWLPRPLSTDSSAGLHTQYWRAPEKRLFGGASVTFAATDAPPFPLEEGRTYQSRKTQYSSSASIAVGVTTTA